MKQLRDLLFGVSIKAVSGSTAIAVRELCFDSRSIQSGDVFVAISGTAADGHRFVDKAIENGARAVSPRSPPRGSPASRAPAPGPAPRGSSARTSRRTAARPCRNSPCAPSAPGSRRSASAGPRNEPGRRSPSRPRRCRIRSAGHRRRSTRNSRTPDKPRPLPAAPTMRETRPAGFPRPPAAGPSPARKTAASTAESAAAPGTTARPSVRASGGASAGRRRPRPAATGSAFLHLPPRRGEQSRLEHPGQAPGTSPPGSAGLQTGSTVPTSRLPILPEPTLPAVPIDLRGSTPPRKIPSPFLALPPRRSLDFPKTRKIHVRLHTPPPPHPGRHPGNHLPPGRHGQPRPADVRQGRRPRRRFGLAGQGPLRAGRRRPRRPAELPADVPPRRRAASSTTSIEKVSRALPEQRIHLAEDRVFYHRSSVYARGEPPDRPRLPARGHQPHHPAGPARSDPLQRLDDRPHPRGGPPPRHPLACSRSTTSTPSSSPSPRSRTAGSTPPSSGSTSTSSARPDPTRKPASSNPVDLLDQRHLRRRPRQHRQPDLPQRSRRRPPRLRARRTSATNSGPRATAGCATGILNAPDAIFDPADRPLPHHPLHGPTTTWKASATNKVALPGAPRPRGQPRRPALLLALPPRSRPEGLPAADRHPLPTGRDYRPSSCRSRSSPTAAFQEHFHHIVQMHGMQDRVAVRRLRRRPLATSATPPPISSSCPRSSSPAACRRWSARSTAPSPIAHDTGGLHDTVDPLDARREPPRQRLPLPPFQRRGPPLGLRPGACTSTACPPTIRATATSPAS